MVIRETPPRRRSLIGLQEAGQLPPLSVTLAVSLAQDPGLELAATSFATCSQRPWQRVIKRSIVFLTTDHLPSPGRIVLYAQRRSGL